jgi:hypothetical protein
MQKLIDQVKMLGLLFGILAGCTFFLAIGNEKDIAKLEARHDSLLVAYDSLEVRLKCANVELFITDAKYGRISHHED